MASSGFKAFHKVTTAAAAAALVVGLCFAASASAAGDRLAKGEFVAAKAAKAPVIDGKMAPGEWDRALAVSGQVTVFEHDLHEVETTVYFTFDDKNFYFLFNCQRAPGEGRLSKTARLNDDYSFGDPSVEVWVTPPAAVEETYQNILNTYPAVQDVKNIPSRGYVSMGWKGNWTLGVSEQPDRYIVEAAVPIKDFGFPTVKNGDIWRFLFCRSAIGAKPRAQADWSVTQGYAEIAQHPQVHLLDDQAVLQTLGVLSVLTGKYDFPMAVAAPTDKAAKVEVQLRWHKDPVPGEGDKVETQTFDLKAGERKEFHFTGQAPDPGKKGYFTITAVNKTDGVKIFEHHLPYTINGYVPKAPAPPANVPELNVRAQYGPETNTVLVRGDILDMPNRKDVASALVRVLDSAGKVVKTAPMGRFIEWYSDAAVGLDDVAELKIPVEDITSGKPAAKVQPLKVGVEIVLLDAAGKVLKSQPHELELKRYKTPWANSQAGISDKVIPPWTPMTLSGSTVGVWNRKMTLDGLGLLKKIDNGGTDQVSSMRLGAVADGKEIPIVAGDTAKVNQTDARIDLAGEGTGAGLKLSVQTQTEFDGYVLNHMTIAPQSGSAKVDNLYLEVVLPESEATHFCSTAGGWSSICDATPAYWSSQSAASGMLLSSFVPYVWLTNSDRAFLWFADSDQGWITDDTKTKPTIEIIRKDGTVTLRVHFIEIPAELTEPTSLTYGYQTFPSRPLPAGWRTIICAQSKGSLPQAKNTYFWWDKQGVTVWAYYRAPFPKSMEESKAEMDASRAKSPDYRPCAGSIAHSIGYYMTYEKAQFPEYVVDWGSTPGIKGSGDVTNCKGSVNFRMHYYQRWVREGGLRGLYVDENYLGTEENFLTGSAYFKPDGRLQRAYSYIGLRDLYKRFRIMCHQDGALAPNLWQHITAGAAYHCWFGDIFFEGENVEPTDLKYDYIEVLPAVRMRSIGSSVCTGGAMTMMCQSLRHRTSYWMKHTHQFLGWVMAHDVLPEQLAINGKQAVAQWREVYPCSGGTDGLLDLYNILAAKGHLWEDNVEFLPYWKQGPITTATPDCVVSAHKTNKRALLWIVNTGRKDQNVEVSIDLAKLGLNKANAAAVNAETDQPIQLTAKGLTVPVLQRDFVCVLLEEK